ncbi:MAG: hypothetical protein Rubg2KO_08410 [Rubricoccaceae bacterium]
MTLRFLTLATAVGALALAGCGDSAGGSSSANLDDIATADPFEQLAYNSGHGAAQQFMSQYDSTFSYAIFEKGFRDGAAGDSAQIAYALGLQAGLGLRADTISNINGEVFLAGLKAGLDGDSLRLTDDQLEQAYEVVQDSVELRQLRGQAAQAMARLRQDAAADTQAADFLRQAERNQVRSDSFFAAIAQQPGIESASGGIYYTVESPGEGDPLRAPALMVTYEGRTIDGEVFDANESVRFDLNEVVPGFRRMLMDMRTGETRTVYIPALLGYGLFGNPGPGGEGGIPPNAPLVFELTVLGVAAPQQQMQGLPPGMTLGN